MDELLRERDILNKNMLKAVSATQKQTDLVKLHEQAKRNLEEEIQNYKDEAQKQRKIIFHLEKERDRYINQASNLTQKADSVRMPWPLDKGKGWKQWTLRVLLSLC
uniref:Cilia- and flagella-associated protein 58 central coiled coil domain-containing protein n=1 Tax=Colobus angolensis palliatus TaxID=336983 RepID=A0A2K5IUF8_COLAP